MSSTLLHLIYPINPVFWVTTMRISFESCLEASPWHQQLVESNNTVIWSLMYSLPSDV